MDNSVRLGYSEIIFLKVTWSSIEMEVDIVAQPILADWVSKGKAQSQKDDQNPHLKLSIGIPEKYIYKL